MNKRILTLLLTVAMLLSLIVVVPMTVSADTIVNVSTKADLEAIATAVNAGTDDYAGKTVVLTNNVDLSGSNWTSIGNSSNPFRGSFNGNGYRITGMTRSGGAIGQNVGLFGVVSSPDGGSTTIQNFKISGSIASNNGGDNAGTVISAVKPSTTGTVTVNITGIWSDVNFDAASAKMTGVGGILGTIAWCTDALQTTINIDSCRYSGTLDSPSAGSNDYGGIMGFPKEACGPRTVNITNCIYDGVMYLRSSSPDDNGGIVGYFKGNGSVSAETHINIADCIVAGQFNMPNKSGQSVTGYVVSEASGSGSTGYSVNRVFYCDDSDRFSGADMGGWYGYYKGGEGSISGLISSSNVTAKTMTQIKALNSGFSDNSKWHFYENGTDLPVPAMIYDNIISNVVPGLFDDTSATEYTITTADEMMEFASLVNGGTTFAGKTIYLGNDIDLAGKQWVSIGKTRGNGSVTFQGTFDGQGHTIANMTSSVNNADGEGGLFGYVVKSATIRNFRLTGTITATSSSSGNKGYYGSVVGCVFQETATINLSNIWSSVNMNLTNSGACGYAVGGLVGWIRNASGTFTLNIDSCVYDGTINCTNQVQVIGGIIGGTNTPGSGRDVRINISNTVYAGHIALNDIYSEDVSCIIGYIKGNGGTTPVTVNLTNVLSVGNITFYTADNRAWNPTSKCVGGVLSSEITGDYAHVTATNLYYKPFSVPTGDGSTTTWNPTALYFNTPTDVTVTGGGAKTESELLALTGSAFTDSSKWTIAAGNYPCPKSIVDTYGTPASLALYVLIGSASELNALATAVNNGTTYEGKNVRLTADIAVDNWTSIGITSSRPFMGNFDGQGHTVTITQTLTNPDGIGGLFGFVRTPASGTVTIKNVRIAGTITATNTTTGTGYFAGLIAAVDANTTGSGGTINIQGCQVSARINAGNTNAWYAVSGFIGFTRHADGLKPLTVNFDSCVWDGVMNFGPATESCGGFVGYTGNNKAGRTLNINITNSVVAGTMMLNVSWSDDTGLVLGYLKGNTNTSDPTAKVTANVTDVISIGQITSSTNINSGKWIGMYATSGTTEVNVNNFYYKTFDIPGLGAVALNAGNGTSNESNVAIVDQAALFALTGSNFTDASKWSFAEDCYPCPKAIVDNFGRPSSMKFSLDPVYVGTAEELNAVAAAVNAGDTYQGKIIKLTADITVDDWTSIGVTSTKPFSGSFDGQGHTVTITQTLVNPDGVGGLISFVRTPESGMVTIKNLTLAGTINATNSNTGSGYFAALVSTVDGNTSGTGGTLNIQNCRVSARINVLKDNLWTAVGGFIGFVRHADGLKPLTINIDSCIWDGQINAGPALYHGGGFIGYTGNNKAGRTLTINLTNSVTIGQIMTNMDWNVNEGVLIGYAKGSYSDAASAKVTINISDVVSMGHVTNSKNYGDESDIGHIGEIDGTTEVNLTNVYYYVFGCKNLPDASFIANGTANSATNVVGMSKGQAGGLTASDFTDGSKWTFKAKSYPNYYIPCPTAFANPSAWMDSLTGTISMTVKAEHRDTADAYEGIRFVASYDVPAFCEDGGTASANFGIILISKVNYDAAADNASVAGLIAAGGLQIPAVKYRDRGATYTVSTVIYNISDVAKDDSIVAVAYVGTNLSEACTACYDDVATPAV